MYLDDFAGEELQALVVFCLLLCCRCGRNRLDVSLTALIAIGHGIAIEVGNVGNLNGRW
jgi:hypothetical protein